MRPVRHIEVSRVLKVVESTGEAARRLAEALDLLGVTRAVVLSGPGRTRPLAEALLDGLTGAVRAVGVDPGGGGGDAPRVAAARPRGGGPGPLKVAGAEPCAGGDGPLTVGGAGPGEGHPDPLQVAGAGPRQGRPVPLQWVGPWVAAAPTQAESARLAAAVRAAAADGLVAIGGGSVLDTGKHVAAQLGLPVVVVPTQISHDGIVSPVAVLRGDDNRKHSLAASMPAAVIAPLHWIAQAPRSMILAGIGDLLSNLPAIEDWRLAADRGRDQFDDFSAFLARHAARSVLRVLAAGQSIDDPAFVVELLEGLMLSGLAMAIAGTSRPCSGSEHLLSHAVDYLFGGVAAHGLQVAAATAPMLRLQGRDDLAREVEDVYRRLGIPCNLAALGLDREAIARAVGQAPAMRPGRFTVLDVVEPGEAVRLLHG